MIGMYFEDFEIGKKFTTSTRTVSEKDIATFLELTGVMNPLFTDAEFAKQNIHRSKIIPGPLTLALASGLGTRLGIFEGTLMAFLGMDEVRFPAPVKPNDTIKVEIEIIEKRETKKPDRGVLKAIWRVINQRKETVMHYEMAYLMKKKQ